QPEVPPWRQTRSSHHRRVELLALPLREPIEVGGLQDGVQLPVETGGPATPATPSSAPTAGTVRSSVCPWPWPQCTRSTTTRLLGGSARTQAQTKGHDHRATNHSGPTGSHGISPHSNILLATGAAILLMKAARICGSPRRSWMSSC